ncbi:MAG: hypothetical protein A2365_02455 [Candidatus Nealsonbacteria bacterium RIFOXYB1_FULL_40_15]|uniref:DUF5667 domain-containing protein n=2 Tax=Candidatus Nealsoniibacteriota TaxID=1817911 RepID=A0A1G2EQM5_9BACT|nr:MAG: hypothetical protein A2365_02455 [Candidatus Nealsonbacteria bacterium RIFOXYB1_FULL_40_15]OGZ27650.1 MAG: hypothetical protein A2427_02780 [Candidatus Nealsonbacteria bacterium RIFOXYC1_FULL_40_7]OGZ28694.1 MAG: hypothetical protein A2562_00585 [Candidatus Nealsonbacteria bacterium RIFOXYD1_FULL_39_11]
MQKAYSKYLFLVLLFLVFCPFVSAQEVPEAPKDINEAKNVLERVLEGIPRAFNEAFNAVVGAFKKILGWLDHIFNRYLYSQIKGILHKINLFLSKEVEKRKPEAQREFKKEVEEIKKEAPSLWNRFKELIK